MTAPNDERIKELKEWLEEVRFNDQAEMLGDIPADLLAVLDEHAALKAEVELLNQNAMRDYAGHLELKALAEKAEAELSHRCDQRDAALESVGLLTAELEAARPLIEAAMSGEISDYEGGVFLNPQPVLDAALALRQRKEKGEPR